ncbi:MAG: GTP-binding protein [Sulfitobacter sp.]
MKPRLPLAVVSGYLGAGKTTLINRLLSEPHGLRLLVMVNDFGAINIDADLLAEAGDDTMTLTNGCVCCTMGADLYMAIGDVLDRDTRPDYLVIEASGIADPARIAQVAMAEPDLVYGGIATVVDGQTYASLVADPLIGAQIERQTSVADLVLISKLDHPDPALTLRLGVQSRAAVVDLAERNALAPLLFGGAPRSIPMVKGQAHAPYVTWSSSSPIQLDHEALLAKLNTRPAGLFRFKGFVAGPSGRGWEVHCVGPAVSVKPISQAQGTKVVGIGLEGQITPEQIENWWLD